MLSAGFALLTVGTVFAYSGWTNSSIPDVLKGLTVRTGGAGDTGFVSLLTAPATGTKEAVTPKSGGGNKGSGGSTKNQKAPKKVPTTPSAASALHGVGEFDGHQVALWIIPYLVYARAHGWTGHVESGYRSEAEQREIYDSGVRPAAVPGTSNHEGKVFPRGAVDVTEAAQLSSILEHMPGGSLLKWAGSADPVHFSYPHDGGY